MNTLRPELGSGPLDAAVHVIGRDYGEQERRAQRPFVGPAGDVLMKALGVAGWRREDVRIDNLVPVQPPANDFTRHDPETLAWGRERLATLLHERPPKLIVALGNEVSAFLLGEAWTREGIQNVRGYLWDTQFGRVLTTVHPAGVLRDWTPWRALLDMDFRKARREIDAGCPPLTQREVTVVTNEVELKELREAIEGLVGGVGRRTRHAGLLAVDIETTLTESGTQRLACCGFAPTPERAWVVPAASGWQRAAIRELCASDVPKVLQNGQFDRAFLGGCDEDGVFGVERLRAARGWPLTNQRFDAMLGWHALAPELAGRKTQVGARKAGARRTVKSLNFLASVYTRDAFWKDYAFASDDARYELCGRDCCVTLEITERMMRQLEAA